MTVMYLLSLGVPCLAGLLLVAWCRRHPRVSRTVRELDARVAQPEARESVSVPTCTYSAESNPSAFLIRSGPPPR